jgi:hypothetical protein
MWVKPAGASSYDTKSTQDTLKTITHPQHMPYISSKMVDIKTLFQQYVNAHKFDMYYLLCVLNDINATR